MIHMMLMDQLFQSQELNKTMSKGNYRYDRTDHISRIQANLREMKEEVTEYLRKSNNDAVPPVLRARHYLILSCINKLNSPNNNSRESLKVIKDLSSERLGNATDGDRFEPLRESGSEKAEKNKIVRQKRTLLKFQNKNTLAEADCLLPNICQIKLDFEEKTPRIPRKNMLENKNIESNPQENQYGSFTKERRYHSIDLNREAKLSENAESQHSNEFRVTNKWLSAKKSKELINTLHKKHSWSDKLDQEQAPVHNEPAIASNQVVDLSKEKIVKNAQVEYMSPKFVYQQRKEAIIKRRAEAIINFSKSKSKKGNLMQKQQKQTSAKRVFHFEKKSPSNPKIDKQFIHKNSEIKNECSPWDENDNVPERSLLTLEGQYF